MQHCCQPFGLCVQTDTNVTGLVVKGPRVSICPRAPSRSVTPLILVGIILKYDASDFGPQCIEPNAIYTVIQKRVPPYDLCIIKIFFGLAPVASQNDWGPLDILILGALHHEPCHINVGLNARPKGLRAVLHSII